MTMEISEKRKEHAEENPNNKRVKLSNDKISENSSKLRLKLSPALPKAKESTQLNGEFNQGKNKQHEDLKKFSDYPKNKTSKVAISNKVSEIFGDDDDDTGEEMPFEAKMKMRNIGRNTPTASGPNSYGKVSNLGFCDHRKLFEKQLKEKADELSKD